MFACECLEGCAFRYKPALPVHRIRLANTHAVPYLPPSHPSRSHQCLAAAVGYNHLAGGPGKLHDIDKCTGLIFSTLRGRPSSIVQNRLFWATGDEGWLVDRWLEDGEVPL